MSPERWTGFGDGRVTGLHTGLYRCCYQYHQFSFVLKQDAHHYRTYYDRDTHTWELAFVLLFCFAIFQATTLSKVLEEF